MTQEAFAVGWDWQDEIGRAGYRLNSLKPLVPFLVILAVIGSTLTQSPPFRIGALVLAGLLCLYLAADFARSLLDPDRNNPFMRGKRIPVTPLQIVSMILLAVLYTSMILIAMVYLMGIAFWPPHVDIMYLTVIAGTFLMSCCAAWQNVRLWCGQAEDYAAELKEVEEDERSREASTTG